MSREIITMHADRVAKGFVELLAAIGIFLGVSALGHCNSGCSPYIKDPTPPTVNEVQYSAQLAACVEKADSKKASRECRKSVDRSWGLCSVTDGIERCASDAR